MKRKSQNLIHPHQAGVTVEFNVCCIVVFDLVRTKKENDDVLKNVSKELDPKDFPSHSEIMSKIEKRRSYKEVSFISYESRCFKMSEILQILQVQNQPQNRNEADSNLSLGTRVKRLSHKRCCDTTSDRCQERSFLTISFCI